MRKIAVFAMALRDRRGVRAPALAQDRRPQAQEAKDAFVRAYRIGPGDLLELKVFEVKELDQTVRVSEDGSITLPLLGRVIVEGLTQEGVVQKLTELLQAKYVKNPQVTIFIKEYKNQQVAVIGAVEKAGSYELVGRKNLLQIISMAGGLQRDGRERDLHPARGAGRCDLDHPHRPQGPPRQRQPGAQHPHRAERRHQRAGGQGDPGLRHGPGHEARGGQGQAVRGDHAPPGDRRRGRAGRGGQGERHHRSRARTRPGKSRRSRST